MSKTKSKNRILILFGLLLALILGLVSFGRVYALWHHEISHTNELVADTIDGSITENFDPHEPSGTVKKEVSFTNSGSCAAFLRIAYSETWTSGSGTDAVILSNKVNNTDVATKNFNMSDWDDGGDGWYYYKKILPPGGTSSQILDKVTFPASYTGDYADYADADYQLYFRMELLQASDSPRTLNSDDVNQTSSQAVWGKEATVDSNGAVSWQ